MDRDFWQHIIENNYRLPEGENATDLTAELLHYIEDPDPEMRDTFAYGILARWIVLYGLLGPDDLRIIIEWLIPRLNEGLGETETDRVFVRSYAALILSLIIYRDNQIGFLDAAEVHLLLDRARHYLVAEKDTRVFVNGRGLANACAHTADLLKFLSRSVHLEKADLQRVLDSIADKLLLDDGVLYTHDEDDRLAQTVMAVMRRDMISHYELSDWLQRFLNWKAGQDTIKSYTEVYHATYQNIKNFLRSLYCQMQLATHLPVEIRDFESEILSAIKVFSL